MNTHLKVSIDGEKVSPGQIMELPQREPFPGGLDILLVFESDEDIDEFCGYGHGVHSIRDHKSSKWILFEIPNLYLKSKIERRDFLYLFNKVSRIEIQHRSIHIYGTASPRINC